ncbi:hypothetical protein [Dethiosulfatarculus sandiegensis]|uniref:Uncharacterized protein n=1 Tax=Dethiosulfatarculus sandiegensis TaxID=1429043 RepID=A0A0D2HUB3_9BACT|nr:hypothetical protein [Dethiosulfatarculus sandiegensis]KIX14018.1 hypothetical protein X474_13215 [Dethiosulfatarculus sandiegensis]
MVKGQIVKAEGASTGYGAMIGSVVGGVIKGAGAKIVAKVGFKAVGVLLNTAFGLEKEPSNKELMDKLNQMDAELHQILDGIAEIEDNLKKLSQQLDYAVKVIVNEIDKAAYQSYVTTIKQWFDDDYMNICPDGPDSCAPSEQIQTLVDTVLDNNNGVEWVLSHLNSYIAGDQVEGTLRSTMDVLIGSQDKGDPLLVYQSFENYFVQMIWLQLKGLILMVDALNYQKDHPRTVAKDISWPGTALSYCEEIFLPNIQNQCQVFLQCVEKLVASLKALSPDPHGFLIDEANEIFLQADLLAYQISGFIDLKEDQLDVKDALEVRLTGNPDWMGRYGEGFEATLVPGAGDALQVGLTPLPNYNSANLEAPVRDFEAGVVYPAWILDTGDQDICFDSFTSQNKVTVAKLCPLDQSADSVINGAALSLKLPKPFDGAIYEFQVVQLIGNEGDSIENPFYFYHLSVLEPYVSGTCSNMWVKGDTEYYVEPEGHNPIKVENEQWYTGKQDGIPCCGFDLTLKITNNGVYDSWDYHAKANTVLNLPYVGAEKVKSLAVMIKGEAQVNQDPGKEGDYKENTGGISLALPGVPDLASLSLTPDQESQTWKLPTTLTAGPLNPGEQGPSMIGFGLAVNGTAGWDPVTWSSSRTFKNKVMITLSDWWVEYLD